MANDEQFWSCIEGVDDADRIDGRLAPALSLKLARLPIPRIVAFHGWLLARLDELLTWELWEAAEVIHQGSCSPDVFCYFRLWVISAGETVFRIAVADPDSLATHPRISRLAHLRPEDWTNDDFPHMEDLLAVAEMAYDCVLSKLRPDIAESLQFPSDLSRQPREIPYQAVPRDFGAARHVKFPRLVATFS